MAHGRREIFRRRIGAAELLLRQASEIANSAEDEPDDLDEYLTDQLADPSITITHILDLAQNFFTKTRWKRTFNLIHGYPLQ